MMRELTSVFCAVFGYIITNIITRWFDDLIKDEESKIIELPTFKATKALTYDNPETHEFIAFTKIYAEIQEWNTEKCNIIYKLRKIAMVSKLAVCLIFLVIIITIYSL
jgi:hypothetical protein